MKKMGKTQTFSGKFESLKAVILPNNRKQSPNPKAYSYNSIHFF